MTELRGEVVKKVVAARSKSEHAAVVLVTSDGELLLRRAGGNAFRDPELDALVGKRICGQGDLAGTTFILARWTEE